MNLFIKSLVKPFYRQHAGLFTFLVFIMVFCVGDVDAAGLIDYHYSLIKGILTSYAFMFPVLVAWTLYAARCMQFLSRTIRRPDYDFLGMLAQLGTVRLLRMLIWLQVILLLPVLIYAIVMMVVGSWHRWYVPASVVGAYCGSLCLAGAGWGYRLLRNPGSGVFFVSNRPAPTGMDRFYGMFLVRYILASRKMLFVSIKVYNCAVLYMMLVNQTALEYDLGMVWLFYSFGLLGHGVMIHQLRDMEEGRLGFYRGLPVSLSSRFMQYAWVYLLLFIPEIVTLVRLTPLHLHPGNAALFGFFGYMILLFLNSLLFTGHYRMSTYLKLLTGVFFLLFLAVLSQTVVWLTLLLLFLSVYLFFHHYYRYERQLLPASGED